MTARARRHHGQLELDWGGAFDALPFIVVDLETTGTSHSFGDRITEAAAVLVHERKVTPVFQTLVNPGRPIPYFITKLTGISDAMVRTAPRFEDIAGELASHLAGRVFVGHNARFDWGFLVAEFSRLARGSLDGLVGAQLCTVRLARRLLPFLPRRNLDAVCWHYGVEITDRHRASGDALATAHVLAGLLRDAERQGIDTLEALDTLLARRTARARKRRRAMPTWSDGAAGA